MISSSTPACQISSLPPHKDRPPPHRAGEIYASVWRKSSDRLALPLCSLWIYQPANLGLGIAISWGHNRLELEGVSMKMKRLTVVALGIFTSLVVCQAVVAYPAAEKKAVNVANAWLALVDQGQYSKSWENAAAYFKAAVGKEQWQTSLTAARKPFGKVLSRKLRSTQYATTLPGAPDGHYVVIQFQTSFERKSSAVETVTPMRDQDGKWRVAGYYIR